MIEINNLRKSFGPKVAVDGVTFNVQKGEIMGFLGPNGAGKSTTMRMLTGFIPPTDGKAYVGGYDIDGDQSIEARRLMGYLPEAAPLYPDMTVLNFLNFVADIRDLQGEQKRKAVDRVIELCFLEGVRHQSIDTLSKGYRHRTCFAQSIIHDPPILIMDEPTDGLDPNQKFEVRSIIRRMGEKKAIIFSTHILEEVEAVCSRAMIIDRGKIVANGTPEELKAKSEYAGTVTLRLSGISASKASKRLGDLDEVRKTTTLEEGDSAVSLRVFPKEGKKRAELARALVSCVTQENWQLEDFHTEEGRLDDVFRQLTEPETA